jgi:hypothetical protein
MRSHPDVPRFPIRRGLAMLAGLLALAGRSTATRAQATPQAGDSLPMQLVFVVFPDTTAADKAVAALPPAQQSAVESYQIVSKDKNGQMTGQQKHDKKGNSQQTQHASQTIDGVFALLNQRPGPSAPNDTSAKGYAPGGKEAGGMPVSGTDASKMQNMLQPGQAAVILVVDNPHASDVEQALSPGAGPDSVVLDLVPVPR